MATPDHEPNHDELTQGPPDNVYSDGGVISWEYRTPEGVRATLGIIQPGFRETFTVAEGGENICLHEPDGTQRLHIKEMFDGKVHRAHILKRGTNREIRIPGGIEIEVSTPEGQGPVAYLCEYPGEHVGD
ncbi:MAG TPA: hypothetical protein VIF43_03390 [Patescibacteria group bacterium]|jgi:uncharacterized protein YaiE (UPF0345 family)